MTLVKINLVVVVLFSYKKLWEDLKWSQPWLILYTASVIAPA